MSGAVHDFLTAFPAIDMDARDPHFMQKLNQLGPVKVDHNMTAVKTVRGIPAVTD